MAAVGKLDEFAPGVARKKTPGLPAAHRKRQQLFGMVADSYPRALVRYLEVT